jgi:CheY-like chemotaxis protein
MTSTVLDVGNCNPDHNAIQKMLARDFDVVLLRAHQLEDAMQILKSNRVDLVLINRKLDIDYSDGMEILNAIKTDEDVRSVPVMIVTNYPEHQEAAVQAGGEYGFGKLELSLPSTKERLSRFLATR